MKLFALTLCIITFTSFLQTYGMLFGRCQQRKHAGTPKHPDCPTLVDYDKPVDLEKSSSHHIGLKDLKVEKCDVAYINLCKSFEVISKYVKVFDFYFMASETSPNEKLLHAASILYQYVDNDGDGIPDHQLVYDVLVRNNATMFMFRNHHEKIKAGFNPHELFTQDLEADETNPGSLMPNKFDESLEETYHFLNVGYRVIYPHIFNAKLTYPGSVLACMMDKARGGHFKKARKRYPRGAWYTDYYGHISYAGMGVEYIYWSLTTYLGAQQYRRSEIADEWHLSTCEELKDFDSGVHYLITNPIYKLPTKLPRMIKRS